MSYRLHILMFALLLMPFATADAGGPPEPEFEALIQMHKDMYRCAVKSQEKVLESSAVNVQNKTNAEKLADIRAKVDKRLNDASDWVSLSVAFLSLSTEIYKLAGEYKEFLTECGTLVKRNPAAAFKYYKAQRYINSEIQRAQKEITASGLLGAGIGKATMEQKSLTIYSLKSTVGNIRSTISSTLFQCRWLLGDKITFMNIYEVLSDEEVKNAAASAVAWWKRKYQ